MAEGCRPSYSRVGEEGNGEADGERVLQEATKSQSLDSVQSRKLEHVGIDADEKIVQGIASVQSMPQLGSIAFLQKGFPNSRNAAGSEKCCGAIGLIFMAFSAMSFSVMTLLVHVLSKYNGFPALELVSFRASVGIVLSLSWSIWQKKSPMPPACSHRLLLLARGLVGIIGMGGNWFIVTQLPFGEATVIVFTAPIFTLFLARIFLRESISKAHLFCAFLSCVGVILVARPEFLGFRPEAIPAYASMPKVWVVMIGLVGALASACTNLLVRRLLDIHAMVTISWLMGAAICILCPLSFVLQTPIWPTSATEWLLIFCVALLGFAGQGFKTQGLKWENAGIGSMMRNLDLFFACVFQATLLSEGLNPWSAVGAALTLMSSIGIGALKVISRRKKKKKVPDEAEPVTAIGHMENGIEVPDVHRD